MRVFVTGASGGIGSAVVAELLAADHHVVGLARSAAAAATISALGAEPLRGGLIDLDVLREAAGAADGVVYLAFSHDFTGNAGVIVDAIGDEARAVAALGEALAGTGKPLVLASGTPAVAGRTSTEDDPFNAEGPMAGRGRTGQAVVDLAGRGVRSAVVRLPRSVHDAGGRYGFASLLIQAARQRSVSAFVGDGTQRWPAVHRDDAAVLFRLALETAPPGSVLHAVGDEGDPMRAIAEVIGRRLGVPVEPAPTEAFGPLGTMFAVDQPSSSTLTRRQFGWKPTGPSLLEDLETGELR
ncbi:SDR family oxidoreductase [Mycobacterium sp. 852002-10029_SCH5224772]|uniref:SDR family oxidoreductase n=1 Tax=Mycobacterium sp. 852002-10029_SCH5224772 TaxID=1834083 RepID=UPI0007FCCA96|nr:SDR family oxidoreductase [Mycobacterium sp. 852002-10029_SCH5224772]OBF05128.1 3-beta hydroxysteroid dehydrogenase [Mycobacterium sp. 852002-10029_SCH5224772]